MTSLSANRPMSAGISEKPSASPAIPPVKRPTPVMGSVPNPFSTSPSRAATSDLTITVRSLELPPTVATVASPRTASAKYSVG